MKTTPAPKALEASDLNYYICKKLRSLGYNGVVFDSSRDGSCPIRSVGVSRSVRLQSVLDDCRAGNAVVLYSYEKKHTETWVYLGDGNWERVGK